MRGSSILSFSPVQFGTKAIRYREYAPAAPLAPYIHCYWTVTGAKVPAVSAVSITGGHAVAVPGETCDGKFGGNAGGSAVPKSGTVPAEGGPAGAISAEAPGMLKVLPDGCTDVVFFKDGSAGLSGTVSGAMRTYMEVPVGGDSLFLGVRFRPGGMRALFRMRMDAMAGQSVRVSDLGREWADLQNRLGESREPWADILNRFFADCMRRNGHCENGPLLYGDQMANLFHLVYRHRGGIPVCRLADSEGLSERHVQRLFCEWTGLSPKTFCRVVRFQFALGRLRTGRFDPDGYSDQPHLIREFRKLAGVTPGLLMSDLFNTKPAAGFILGENQPTTKER